MLKQNDYNKADIDYLKGIIGGLSDADKNNLIKEIKESVVNNINFKGVKPINFTLTGVPIVEIFKRTINGDDFTETPLEIATFPTNESIVLHEYESVIIEVKMSDIISKLKSDTYSQFPSDGKDIVILNGFCNDTYFKSFNIEILQNFYGGTLGNIKIKISAPSMSGSTIVLPLGKQDFTGLVI